MRAIQNAALGNEEEILGGWLAQSGLADRPRLVNKLVAEKRWTRAIETVLGDFLQAVCVVNPSHHAPALPDATLVLVADGSPCNPTKEQAEDREARGRAGRTNSLDTKVQHAGRLESQLSQVLCAESIDEALQRSVSLESGQSLITPEGIWVGSGWVRINRAQRHVGLMAREQEIRDLAETRLEDEKKIGQLSHTRLELRTGIEALENERQQAQLRLTDANRQSLEGGATGIALQQDLVRARQRLEVLAQDDDTVSSELTDLCAVIAEARDRLQGRSCAWELDLQRPARQVQQDLLLVTCNEARQAANRERMAVSQILIECEALRAAQGAATVALERVTQQRNQLVTRIAELELHTQESEPPLLSYQLELDYGLSRQVEIQAELSRQRDGLTSVEQLVKSGESRRHELEKQVTLGREEVEALRIHVRELEVRREGLSERFAATGMVLAEVIALKPADANLEQWDQRLADARRSIERLGPINLAAIEEFSEQSERKTYFDSQHADLSAALQTLEHAIRRIDRESRTRFQETFDNINAGLKHLFPRLFGGGHAYLTLEGDDLLVAGVTVMARPPGKRNSHIHLLSGVKKR